jgi:putative ABC transport system substrate-binding protein
MNRRKTLILSASAAVAALDTFAQQPSKVWRIGILPGGLYAPRKFQWDAFQQRMRELGYLEGKNVQYVIRAPEREGAPYGDLAADLVGQNVDVIVATASLAIAAAKKATQRIPIVMCPSSTDPVAEGFVNSLRKPGGNITGVDIQAEEQTGRRLQLLHEIMPKASRIAFLNSPGGKTQLEPAMIASRQLGVQLLEFYVDSAEAVPSAFEAIVKARASAVLVASTGFNFGQRTQIIALALQHRRASMYTFQTNVDAGGLISYGPSETEYYRQAAVFVDKIFKGSKAGDLPVEQPTKFDLVINMKTAKALGITVPPVVHLQADRVIN